MVIDAVELNFDSHVVFSATMITGRGLKKGLNQGLNKDKKR